MKTASKSFGEDYQCEQDWPDNSFLQCGDDGIVFKDDKDYTTAFFEAFLLKTFLRGEGENINIAEEKAFEQYFKIKNCPNHEFERYKSGGSNIGRYGICKHCNYRLDMIFIPEHCCVTCGKENVNFELDIIELKKGNRNNYCLEHFMDKVKNLNKDVWENVEILKMLNYEQREKTSKYNLNVFPSSEIFSDMTLNYIRIVHFENMAKKEIIDLYTEFFGKDVLKVKYPKDFMFGDEIESFIKRNKDNINKKIFESIEELKKEYNYKFNFFSMIKIKEELRMYEANLYRINFFVENKIDKNIQEKIYYKLNLPFESITEESKYVAHKIEEIVNLENENIKKKKVKKKKHFE